MTMTAIEANQMRPQAIDRYYVRMVEMIREAAAMGVSTLHIHYDQVFPDEPSISSAVYDNQEEIATRLRALGYTVLLIPDTYYTVGGIRIAWGPNAQSAFRGDRATDWIMNRGIWLATVFVLFVLGTMALAHSHPHLLRHP